MSLFHGKGGKVVWNAENGGADVDILNVLTWNFDAVGDVAEVTSMSNAAWKNFLGGFTTWTVTVDCNSENAAPDVPYEAGDSETPGGTQGLGGTWEDSNADPQLKVFLELWFTQTATDGLVYGPAIATGISHTTDANDAVKVTYTFQGNGEILFKDDGEPIDFVEPLS